MFKGKHNPERSGVNCPRIPLIAKCYLGGPLANSLMTRWSMNEVSLEISSWTWRKLQRQRLEGQRLECRERWWRILAWIERECLLIIYGGHREEMLFIGIQMEDQVWSPAGVHMMENIGIDWKRVPLDYLWGTQRRNVVYWNPNGRSSMIFCWGTQSIRKWSCRKLTWWHHFWFYWLLLPETVV